MSIFNTVSGVFGNAIDYVMEKNKSQAQINRLRLLMRKESQLMDNSYIALGKYYYNELRNKEINDENEKICQTIDNSKVRMNNAREHCQQILEQQMMEKNPYSTGNSDNADITICCSYEDELYDNSFENVDANVNEQKNLENEKKEPTV